MIREIKYTARGIGALFAYGVLKGIGRYRVLKVPLNKGADTGYIVVDRSRGKFGFCWDRPSLEYVDWKCGIADFRDIARLDPNPDVRRNAEQSVANLLHGPNGFWEADGNLGDLLKAMRDIESTIKGAGLPYHNELSGLYISASCLDDGFVEVGCSAVMAEDFPRIQNFIQQNMR